MAFACTGRRFQIPVFLVDYRWYVPQTQLITDLVNSSRGVNTEHGECIGVYKM